MPCDEYCVPHNEHSELESEDQPSNKQRKPPEVTQHSWNHSIQILRIKSLNMSTFGNTSVWYCYIWCIPDLPFQFSMKGKYFGTAWHSCFRPGMKAGSSVKLWKLTVAVGTSTPIVQALNISVSLQSNHQVVADCTDKQMDILTFFAKDKSCTQCTSITESFACC